MAYSGAFIGFVIMYLVPITVHLVTVRRKHVVDRGEYKTLISEKELEIAEFLKKKKINYIWEFGVHIGILIIGLYIFFAQLVALLMK